MKGKRKRIHYKKERALLSDVLPFEIPVTFSNRHFYDFLTDNKIQIKDDDKIDWDRSIPALDSIVNLMFGGNKNYNTVPFNFKISHKADDFRELSVVHPRNQIHMVDFYERYKYLILYYCNMSEFSIRKPYRVAKFIYHDDKTHSSKLSDSFDQEYVEQQDKEYENLKTFLLIKNIVIYTSFTNQHTTIIAKKNLTHWLNLMYRNVLIVYTHIQYVGRFLTKKL